MKGFLTVKDLGPASLQRLVVEASRLRDTVDNGEAPPQTLDGRCVANLFFEPSTRTRLSFDLAAQRLGADIVTFDQATSSASKGESLRDTVSTIAAIGADMMVVRHGEGGTPQRIAEWTGLPVINAGDGVNEHPTQTVLDLVTIKRHFGKFDGLRVGIVGDISHSRVAAGLMHVLPELGAHTVLIGPENWLPAETTLPVVDDLDPMLTELDIVYLLRVQTERGGRITDSYIARFQLDRERLARMRESAVIMHPGPINRGVEITDDVADSTRSLITEQVRNGVPTRMAVFQSIEVGR